MKPYIGVTGFTEQAQVVNCLNTVPQDAKRLFMVGVLLSSKTINGGTNKYPVRYPRYNKIKDIFVDDERCLNMIHYVTDDKSTLAKQLLDAAEIGGKHCQGFQLNVVWPDINMLKEVKKELPDHKFVIQCSGSAMRRFESAPSEATAGLLKTVVAEYQKAGVIDYLLIDPSGGRGKAFDASVTVDTLKPHLSQKDYGLGVAGGLKASTIGNLVPVLTKVPHLFWDAEGGLRDENDNFLPAQAFDYLKASYGYDALLNAQKQYETYYD